jgi:hypothetical protein
LLLVRSKFRASAERFSSTANSRTARSTLSGSSRERDLLILLAGMQRVEVGDAIDAENDGLAVEHEPLLPVLKRRLEEDAR